MVNYILRQYQILINKGYRQASDGSWHMENELEKYKLKIKEIPENREKLTRSNMLNRGYLTHDFINYYSSAESFLRKMKSVNE